MWWGFGVEPPKLKGPAVKTVEITYNVSFSVTATVNVEDEESISEAISNAKTYISDEVDSLFVETNDFNASLIHKGDSAETTFYDGGEVCEECGEYFLNDDGECGACGPAEDDDDE